MSQQAKPFDALVQQSLVMLGEAVERLPSEQKAAYVEAKRRCPKLVDSDFCPMKFVYYDAFDFDAAARRLAQTWTVRRELFGERAFLPLHQTVNGALSPDDVKVLSTGYLSLSPGKDSHNRPVICYVPSRLQLVSDMDDALLMQCRKRCTFYVMASVLMAADYPSALKFSAVTVIDDMGLKWTLQPHCQACIDIIVQLPMYMECGHITHCPLTVLGMEFLRNYVPPMLRLFGSISSRFHIVTAGDNNTILNQLLEQGIPVESAPYECGGAWSMDEFHRWQRQRIQHEHQLGFALQNVAAATWSRPERKCPPAYAMMADGMIESNIKMLSDEARGTDRERKETAPHGTGKRDSQCLDRASRQPTPDYVHSQRKRIRRKKRLQALESSYSDLMKENIRLKAETLHLETLLQQAQVTLQRSGMKSGSYSTGQQALSV